MTQKAVPAFEVTGFSIMNMSIRFYAMLCFLQLTFKGLERISRGRGCRGHCTSLVIFLWFETFQNKMLGGSDPQEIHHTHSWLENGCLLWDVGSKHGRATGRKGKLLTSVPGKALGLPVSIPRGSWLQGDRVILNTHLAD